MTDTGSPDEDAVQPMPDAALQQSFDDSSPEGYRW
jgi:hypothetical protein